MQKASRLIKANMMSFKCFYMKKNIHLFWNLLPKLTSCIAMSWTYLQTIPTIATSYFEEKTEVS